MKTLRNKVARCGQKTSRLEHLPFTVPSTPALIGRTHHPDSCAFTVEEHLDVQRQIEQRALELWCQRGGEPDNALDDWLKAEEEVVIGFIRIRVRFGASQPPITFSQPSQPFNRRRK